MIVIILIVLLVFYETNYEKVLFAHYIPVNGI